MESPFNLLEKRFAPLYEKQLQTLSKVTLISECECCRRKASNFNGEAYQVIDSYKSVNTMCKVCTIFSIQNGDLLGEENDKSSYRLTSFKGGYLVIPVDDGKPMELWTGGGYLKRLKNSDDLNIVDLTGYKAKAALLEDRSNRLVIEMSVRRELYFRNLCISSDKSLYIATDTGIIGVNYDEYQELKSAVIDSNLKPVLLKDLIAILRSTKRNTLNVTSKSATDMFKKLPQELLLAIRNTSQSPIGFMFMLDALSAK